MNKTFIGERQDSLDFIESLQGDVADILSIKDDLQIKKANVYFVKIEDGKEIYSQILPTPKISRFPNDFEMVRGGGGVNDSFVILTGIPVANYNLQELETNTLEGQERFFVIDGLAYIANHIERRLVTWQVNLTRFRSYNRGELMIIPPVRPEQLKVNDDILTVSEGVYVGV